MKKTGWILLFFIIGGLFIFGYYKFFSQNIIIDKYQQYSLKYPKKWFINHSETGNLTISPSNIDLNNVFNNKNLTFINLDIKNPADFISNASSLNSSQELIDSMWQEELKKRDINKGLPTTPGPPIIITNNKNDLGINHSFVEVQSYLNIYPEYRSLREFWIIKNNRLYIINVAIMKNETKEITNQIYQIINSIKLE